MYVICSVDDDDEEAPGTGVSGEVAVLLGLAKVVFGLPLGLAERAILEAIWWRTLRRGETGFISSLTDADEEEATGTGVTGEAVMLGLLNLVLRGLFATSDRAIVEAASWRTFCRGETGCDCTLSGRDEEEEQQAGVARAVGVFVFELVELVLG